MIIKGTVIEVTKQIVDKNTTTTRSQTFLVIEVPDERFPSGVVMDKIRITDDQGVFHAGDSVTITIQKDTE